MFYKMKCLSEIKKITALTPIAHLVECHPATQKVTGSILGHRKCLGYGLIPGWGVYEKLQIDFSLSLYCFFSSFLPPPTYKNKLIKSF